MLENNQSMNLICGSFSKIIPWFEWWRWLKNMKNNYQIFLIICSICLFFAPNLINNQSQGFELKNISDVSVKITIPDWYEKPNNYSQLVSWYQSLESSFPDYLEVYKANELYNTGKVD